jgi:hypothetical protein
MNVSDDVIRDIDLARNILLSENYSFVIIKDEKIIRFNRDVGIKPILETIEEMGNDLEGAVIGDRILGKASAFLWRYSKIKGIYSPQATKTAIAILIIGGIPCQADEMIPSVNSNDYYSFEEILQDVESPVEAYKILKENVIRD